MTQQPKKKPAHSKGGYNSSNGEKNVPKNRNVPPSPPLPPRDDVQIYVNPNNYNCIAKWFYMISNKKTYKSVSS
jgi:hypothetical protein